ncbi:hypothetical protein JX266_003335 [Neoarthrinium moseri]|nr:hypothetical protein JX266_003335 [Neoarthrinium moseri]
MMLTNQRLHPIPCPSKYNMKWSKDSMHQAGGWVGGGLLAASGRADPSAIGNDGCGTEPRESLASAPISGLISKPELRRALSASSQCLSSVRLSGLCDDVHRRVRRNRPCKTLLLLDVCPQDALVMSAESVRASSRWATRSIPLVLAVSIGYATYVTAARVCADYLINDRRDTGPAIAILVLYFLLLLLMIAAYLRTVHMINTDIPVVPLGPLALERKANEKRHSDNHRSDGDLEGRPYYAAPDPNPDSPGLEQFYTKDVFVCENDGRPKWCSECCNWKPDRAHHSSEINRCVMRMDHYCPWVGGMIGENSFKFFTQFTMYTFCFCGVVLGAAGSTLKREVYDGASADPHLIAILAIAGFYGLFTFLMTVTSWRYIATNMTNVDMLGARRKVYQLAVRIPRGSGATEKYHTVTYPLPNPTQMPNGQPDAGRDALANRTFAILKTDPGENPWDLGVWENWKEIMGPNVLDWFLPIRRSPCTNHDNHESFYRMGSLLNKVRAEYGIDALPEDETGRMELRDLGGNRS